MRHLRPLVATALVLVLAVSVPGLSARESPRTASPNGAPLVTDAVRLPVATVGRPLSPSAPVRLTLTLGYSHPRQLDQLLQSVADPRSTSYHRFLTAAEFRSRFAPSTAAIETAIAALTRIGGTDLVIAPGGTGVQAIVPAAGVDSLLGVELVMYAGSGGHLAYTALGTPRLPPSLAGLIVGVGGLSDAGDARLTLAARDGPPRPVSNEFVTSPTGGQWQFGSDYAEAFGASGMWPSDPTIPNATFPTHVAIATLLASGYNNSTESNTPDFDPAVLSAYFNDTFSSAWPHPTLTGVPVPLSGVPTPPAPGFDGGLRDDSEDEIENSLDLEMAGSLAPGAELVNFYFGGSVLGEPFLTYQDLADDFAEDLAAALNYDYTDSLAVVSTSFGLLDLNDSLWNAELEEAAATGVTVVSASGDQGDAPAADTDRGSQWPEWPATASFGSSGSISVGGATVTLNGSATSVVSGGGGATPAFDPNVTGVASASAWYEKVGAGARALYAGTEGGTSSVYGEPSWQFHSAAQPAIFNATVQQGAGALGREGPDVGMPANNTDIFVFQNASHKIFEEVVGGTSVAAPVLAGVLADVVAVASVRAKAFAPLGFVDPELYRIASFYASAAVEGTPLEAADPFTSVVTGGNWVFRAAPGWDALTGWGLVNGSRLLTALANRTISTYAYTGPTPGFPPRSTAPLLSAEWEYILIGVGALVAAVVIVAAARPEKTPAAPAAPPASLYAPRPSAPPTPPRPAPGPATFTCPFCGTERPAEPTRCPNCGRF